MSSKLNPIPVGNSKRIENLWTKNKKGKVRKPTPPNARETTSGFFNEPSLNYSSQVLRVDPSQRYT